jgi:endonuclease/exonuclease/phosphatase family metal-dependent hydrolase
VTPVRVGTWNVHGLRTGIDAVARIVRDEELDALLVQESGPRRRLRRLGERLGWVVCADPPAFPRRRVQNAVLIRPGLVGILRSRLLRFAAAPFLQPRGALIAQVDERCTLASIHLGLNRAQRLDQARQLLRALESVRGAIVVGGDLNAHPDDPATGAVATRFADVWSIVGDGTAGLTMPAADPTARIDYVFTNDDVRPTRAWIAGDATRSDHLMVVADLELPA